MRQALGVLAAFVAIAVLISVARDRARGGRPPEAPGATRAGTPSAPVGESPPRAGARHRRVDRWHRSVPDAVAARAVPLARADGSVIDPESGDAIVWGTTSAGEEAAVIVPALLARADMNGDWVVDEADVVRLMESLGAGEARADINGDGAVDGRDLHEVLAVLFGG